MISDLKTRPEDTTFKRPRRRVTMLQPQAYDESLMPSLQLAKSSRFARRVGHTLLAAIVLWMLLVLFAPWQQNVRGSGSVIGFYPQDRPQTIEAPMKGRVSRLGDEIYENARVAKGQVIAEIQDLDESYLQRLENQLEASRFKVESLRQLVDANRRNLTAANSVKTTLEAQLATYRSVREQVLQSADALIEAAEGRVRSAQQRVEEHRAALTQVELDYDRQKTLYENNIKSALAFQQAERKLSESKAKVSQAEADLDSAEADLKSKRRDRDAIGSKAQADIEYVTSLLRKAEGDVAKSESEISKSESELQTAQNSVTDAETKLARQQMQTIRAPVAGVVTQILPNVGSRMLKPGDPICVIVPDAEERAVQIWLDGNDATLVEPGRHVRLQFEGWPAVQFAGWPSVAVGTFGGTIVSVDATDDGRGRFRALVRPDEADQEWPQNRYLRQGVRANGWVLLNRVPLWFEIWRKMNGFPPVVDFDPDAKTVKTLKLPKP